MTSRLRVVLLIVLLVAASACWAAMIAQGTDGKTYLMLDSDEAEQLGERMKALQAEIDRLKRERKAACGLI